MVRRRRGEERRIAIERINILFTLAEKCAVKGNTSRANRYAHLAWKIGMRYNISLPKYLKRRYCRGCHTYLQPGINCRVRLTGDRITLTCESCGRFYRFPFLKERRSGKRE
ncbi:MAG: ribonuclease P protein component 4 [Thermoplasmata archaeon]